MRPRSIAGPIILISIGVLFLVNNLRPDIRLFTLITTYWPFLLIGWGALRLAEILSWHGQGRPLPQFGISGGEWTLAIVMAFLGTGFLYGSRFDHDWPRGFRMRGLEMLGEPFDYPLSGVKQTATDSPKIVLEKFRGNARITGTDSNEVKVTGNKRVRAFDRSEADRNNQSTPFEIVEQGGVMIIRMNHDRITNSSQVSADIELLVPKGASIDAHGRRGDFDINDIRGAVEITSDNAGVRMNNIGGAVRLDLIASDVVKVTNAKSNVEVKATRGQELEFENIEGSLSVNGNYHGDMQFRAVKKVFRFDSIRTVFRIENVPGIVRINSGNISGSNLMGPIVLTTNSKDVEFTDFTNSLEVTVDKGDLEIRPGRIPVGKIAANTKSGRVEIALPAVAKFDLTATTDKGEVENEWGSPLEMERSGRRMKLTGATGQGPAITAHTNRGNVVIRKGDLTVTPSAPAAPKAPVTPKAPESPVKQTDL